MRDKTLTAKLSEEEMEKMKYIYEKDKQNFKEKTGVLLSRNAWIVRRLTE